MLLAQTGIYNDLSPELRKELTEKVKLFGDKIRFKFNISHPNPDPQKYNGDVIWPNIYTLDPAVFSIRDKYEKREGHQETKRIGLVDNIDEKGIPNKFKKIRVSASARGIYRLEIDENPEHFDFAMYLLLHPKLKDGMFQNKQILPVFELLDEKVLAKEERKERSARKLAMDTAEKMSDAEVSEFADAMNWDSTEEVEVLRNKVEELAEHTPELFNDLVGSKKMKYQSAIKRAIDKQIWGYDPSECKITWLSTGQVIVTLGSNADGRSDFERLAEWFMTAGKNADTAYNKLLSLEKQKEQV